MRAFLRLLEAHGAGAIPAGDFAAATETDGAEVTRALVAAGVVKEGPRATTWPCEGDDCAREVRELPGRVRLVAMCTRHPAACEMLRLDPSALAQRVIDVGAFVRLVQTTLRVEPPATTRGVRASASMPLHLGEQTLDGVARDVFLARRANAPALRALLAERVNVPRRTLVLVPTARALPPELAARYATGRVVIEVLSDRMTVRGGAVVETPRLRAVDRALDADVVSLPVPEVRDAQPAGRPLAVGKVAPAQSILARLPRPSRWGEVTLFSVEDEGMIGVEIAKRQVHLSAADLGLGTKRLRKPTHVFQLLRTICDGNGLFVTRNFGTSAYGKTLMSDLRGALCRAFGIDEDPFDAYSRRDKRWRPRFVALAASPVIARGIESELTWMERGADGGPRPPLKRGKGRAPR